MNQAELLEILMLQTAIDDTRILSRNAFCHALLMVGLFLTCRESECARKEAELKRKLEQREGEYKSSVKQLQHKVKLHLVHVHVHFSSFEHCEATNINIILL